MAIKTCLGLAMVFGLFLTSEATARPFTRDCPSGADANLREVVQYLDDHMETVMAIYERDNSYHARRGAERRVKRRLGRDRKLGNLWFACANKSAPLCNDSSGRHAFGAASNKIRLCYQKIYAKSSDKPGKGFCDLLKTVSHEFGHAVGIKKSAGHSKNSNDRVYRWGYAWRDYCVANDDDKDLLN